MGLLNTQFPDRPLPGNERSLPACDLVDIDLADVTGLFRVAESLANRYADNK